MSTSMLNSPGLSVQHGKRPIRTEDARPVSPRSVDSRQRPPPYLTPRSASTASSSVWSLDHQHQARFQRQHARRFRGRVSHRRPVEARTTSHGAVIPPLRALAASAYRSHAYSRAVRALSDADSVSVSSLHSSLLVTYDRAAVVAAATAAARRDRSSDPSLSLSTTSGPGDSSVGAQAQPVYIPPLVVLAQESLESSHGCCNISPTASQGFASARVQDSEADAVILHDADQDVLLSLASYSNPESCLTRMSNIPLDSLVAHPSSMLAHSVSAPDLVRPAALVDNMSVSWPSQVYPGRRSAPPSPSPRYSSMSTHSQHRRHSHQPLGHQPQLKHLQHQGSPSQQCRHNSRRGLGPGASSSVSIGAASRGTRASLTSLAPSLPSRAARPYDAHSRGDHLEEGQGDTDEATDTCPICFDDLSDRPALATTECPLPHHFHRDCLVRYFEKSVSSKNAECPMCRTPIPDTYLNATPKLVRFRRTVAKFAAAGLQTGVLVFGALAMVPCNFVFGFPGNHELEETHGILGSLLALVLGLVGFFIGTLLHCRSQQGRAIGIAIGHGINYMCRILAYVFFAMVMGIVGGILGNFVGAFIGVVHAAITLAKAPTDATAASPASSARSSTRSHRNSSGRPTSPDLSSVVVVSSLPPSYPMHLDSSPRAMDMASTIAVSPPLPHGATRSVDITSTVSSV